jgi:hypothetical protein
MLEPDDGKLSSPVLRGLAPSNGGWLLGLRPEGRGSDCLKEGANCQTCCSISTTLEGGAAR